MYNQIEQGIIKKIKTIPDFKIVKGYEGDFEKGTLTELLGLMPCALVVYENSDMERANKRKIRKMRWTIFIGTKSFKKGAARPQVYDLLRKVENCLDQQKIDEIEMNLFEITRERFFFKDNQMVVYEQNYETKFYETNEMV